MASNEQGFKAVAQPLKWIYKICVYMLTFIIGDVEQ